MPRELASRHEVAVYKALLDAGPEWLSSNQIAERASVSARTARAHALRLAQLGIIEQTEVFPGHRYRMRPDVDQSHRDYATRLRQAATALHVDLGPTSRDWQSTFDTPPHYQEAVRRLTAELKGCKRQLAESDKLHGEELRILRAQLNEGLTPEVIQLRKDVSTWRRRAQAAEARLREARKVVTQ